MSLKCRDSHDHRSFCSLNDLCFRKCSLLKWEWYLGGRKKQGLVHTVRCNASTFTNVWCIKLLNSFQTSNRISKYYHLKGTKNVSHGNLYRLLHLQISNGRGHGQEMGTIDSRIFILCCVSHSKI